MYMMEKRGQKGHTNNPAVSALPWSGTPSWDDDIIPSKWSASNLVKGFDCFLFLSFFFFFCPSVTWLFPSHLSLFSTFSLLRPFLYIKKESVRDSHGRYWKEEELHFSCFLSSLIVTFLFKFNERSLSIGGGGGEGRYYFKSEGLKLLAPLRLTAQKSYPLQKCVPQKL